MNVAKTSSYEHTNQITSQLMKYKIRLASLKDFWALLKTQSQITQETDHLAVTREDPQISKLYTFAKAILHRKRIHTFIASDKERLVGYITIITGKFFKVRETVYIVMGVIAQY